MDTRITDLPALRLVGHAARVPLVHEGVNPAIAEHVASIPVEETLRLKALNDAALQLGDAPTPAALERMVALARAGADLARSTGAHGSGAEDRWTLRARG